MNQSGIIKSLTATGLMLLVALGVYWPALHGGVVLDDALWMQHSPFQKSWAGLMQLWRGTDLPDFFPLTSTSFWIEWQFWDVNPFGYHVVNVVLHALSAVLLWRVLLALKVPAAFWCALLFLVHPVNVESVAWISERKNTLCMVFYLLSVWWFLRSESEGESGRQKLEGCSSSPRPSPPGEGEECSACSRSRVYYALSLGAFVLALLSKTSVVTLPVVLLLCVWWRRSKIERRDWFRVLPFFGLAVVLGVVTVWFQSHQAIGHDVVLTASFPARLAGAGWAVWFYLWKAVWPVNLAFVYPRWTVEAGSFVSWLPDVGLALVAVGLWLYRKKAWTRAVIFGLGYFLLTLAPILGFVNIYYFRYSMVADHWQYFSIIGVIGLVVAGINFKIQNPKSNVVFAVLVLTLSVLSWEQAKLYGNEERLWTDTVKKNPTSWMAHEILGHYLGNTPEAMEHFKESLRLNPDNPASHVNLGMILMNAHDLEGARKEFEAAREQSPKTFAIWFDLGAVYDDLGKNAESEAAYRGALRLKPEDSAAHNYLGAVLRKQGKEAEAVVEFQEALRLDPGNGEARENLEKVSEPQRH